MRAFIILGILLLSHSSIAATTKPLPDELNQASADLIALFGGQLPESADNTTNKHHFSLKLSLDAVHRTNVIIRAALFAAGRERLRHNEDKVEKYWSDSKKLVKDLETQLALVESEFDQSTLNVQKNQFVACMKTVRRELAIYQKYLNRTVFPF